MKKLISLYSIIFVALTMLLFSACRKTEFMPDPEGVQVPYENTATKTVEELLTASPAKIFLTAWQKSKIKETLKANGNKVVYTVFAPSDAAMQSAGLTASAIAQMPAEEVDSLVLFYTSIGAITRQELSGRSESMAVKTLLPRPGLFLKFNGGETGSQIYDAYFYRHYVAQKSDDLLIDGKNFGKINYQQAKDGALYLIDKTIERPYKTMLQVLTEDGRFTIFLAAQRIADERYLDKIGSDVELLFGYRPEDEELISSFAYERKFYEKGWGVNKPPYAGYVGKNVDMSTTFAPTDEAFHKAGFQTVDDVLKFNERGEPVRFDDNNYVAKGSYSMDSVFTYHRDWGRMFATKDPGYGIAEENATVFFSNDLQPGLLNDYYVNIGGTAATQYGFKMPLEFMLDGTTVSIKVKGSEHAGAKVIATDINTLNGPIHVVDNLILPKGFKIK